MNKAFIRKAISYALGSLVLAAGVTFSVKSGLGVSPNTSVPFALSLITGIDLGFWSGAIFVVFVLCQVALLRRDFKPLQFLQVGTSILFGFFVSLTNAIFAFVPPPQGLGPKLGFSLLGIVLVGAGIFLYFSTGFMPMSPEGLVAAIAGKVGKSIPNVKLVVDCTLVALATLLTRVVYGSFQGVGVGTVLAALLVSRVLGLLMKHAGPRYKAFLACTPKEVIPKG